ncbi:hypothetical protein D0869_10768 [Hortaea werneckii]|uniref:Carboxylic ester hydrolase n=1 Tax=Hortaea werneckii TaxID=91943 RepID=A0A3M6Y5T7_HORWE|nr:carboxylesterase family protein [Hortaea werneckii]RMX76390.1 hypothetical protein D0869_10768 [Hortaea werneckii]RMX98382.1 hypothetical protein D0868_10121 [Hortaea werneckii]
MIRLISTGVFVGLIGLVQIVTSRPSGWPHYKPPKFQGEAISTVVDLGYSKYEGLRLEPAFVNQWLGMRFAAPPTGDLRWRAPQPAPLNDTEVLSATSFGATCLGYWESELSDSVNEDCLYLNVFAPANATTASKLPVWFFIQGGGYAGNLDQNFNATEVIEESGHSMVFVQINYRVGAFGFLASESIRENGDLNVGLLDQRFALHWVQKYIHLFGGDPDHVVIAGDSAGAGSVAFHMAAYGGRDDNLFVGGVIESSFWPTHRRVSDMEFQFDRFAANLSCGPNETPDGNVMDCLRSKNTATLQSADYAQAFPGRTSAAEWYFLPVVDGDFSQDLLYNQFERGSIVRVPVLVGDDTDEGTGFVPNATSVTGFLDFMKDNFPKLSTADLQRISVAYPEDGFDMFPLHADYFAATANAYGENTFTCPGIEVSNSIAAYLSPDQVWNYRYNVEDRDTVAAGYGVPHVSEKTAIYGVNNTGPCDGCSYATYNAPMVPIVMHYWISFIKHLNPNVEKPFTAPEWQPWIQRCGHSWHPQRLKFELNATEMESVPADQLERCDLWKDLAAVTEQ